MRKVNLKLYTRYRNSAGQRVRTALNIKGIDYEYMSVGSNGVISQEGYVRDVNPQGLIPTLSVDGELIIQSTALIEFIEETFDAPSLLPEDMVARARSRAFAQVIACEMHPINVGRVKTHLVNEHGQSEADWSRWYDYWVHHGYRTLEDMLERRTSKTAFAFDEKPTVADLYLIPQLYNARVFDIDVSAYPLLNEIDEKCRALDAFERAMPENQSDYPGTDAVG
jgi:maleylacetoacetate isomerase